MSQLEGPLVKDILHWRQIWNKEGREVKVAEYPSYKGNKQSDTPDIRKGNEKKESQEQEKI